MSSSSEIDLGRQILSRVDIKVRSELDQEKGEWLVKVPVLRRRRIDVLRGRLEVAESLSEVGGDLHFGPTKNYRNRTIVLPRFLREKPNRHLTNYCAPEADAIAFTASNGAPCETRTSPPTCGSRP